jgi:AraC-like DNA-binding protein
MAVKPGNPFVSSGSNVQKTSQRPADPNPIVVSSEIRDVDAMAAHIEDGIVGEYVQLEARCFRGRWTVVRVPTFTLQFSRECVASVHRLRIPANRWAFFVPLAAPEGVRWDGRPVSDHLHIACAPGAESLVFDPGGAEFAVISVAPESAPDLVEMAFSKLAASGCGVVQPRRRDAERFRSALVELRATAEFRPDTISRDRIAQIDVFVRDELSRCLRCAVACDGSGEASRSRTHIVRRAEAFFREHVGEPVSIARLSTITGVSERSFRNAFYHVCTTSPKKYLRMWQLHQVRHSLRGALTGTATVTDVATQHGFYELGRFAGEYRALFGEAPSQTLHRARSTPQGATHSHQSLRSA